MKQSTIHPYNPIAIQPAWSIQVFVRMNYIQTLTMQFIAIFLLMAAVLSGCAASEFQTERVRQEQQRLDRLIEHNRALLESIRIYEAKLDTLEKMRQGQLKALYRVR